MTTDKIPAEIMLNEVGLKPCPFCGGDAELIDATKILGKFRIIHRCEAVGAISVERFDGGNAIEAWNRRATVQVEQKPVAWLAEGYGYRRVFIDRGAAEKLALGGTTLTPLYTHPVDRDSASEDPKAAEDRLRTSMEEILKRQGERDIPFAPPASTKGGE